MSQQILFTSEDQSLQSFSNFYPASNNHLVTALKEFLAPETGFGCMYLYGQSGSGKTHLLKSAVQAVGGDTVYLDLGKNPDPENIHPEESGFLALDNLEAALEYGPGLMMLYESAMQTGSRLLFASTRAPRACGFALEDLVSRLASGQVFEIRTLGDVEKVAALKFRADLRGFDLSDEVVNYVINRYPRDFGTLFELLDLIDNASLTRQRRITVPFIRQLEKG